MDIFGFFKKNVQAVSVLMKTPSKENPIPEPPFMKQDSEMGRIFDENLENIRAKPKSEEDPDIAFPVSNVGDTYSYPLYSQF